MGAASRAFVVTLVVFLAFALALFSWKDAQQPPAESVAGNASQIADEGNETPSENATGLANASDSAGPPNATQEPSAEPTAYQGEGLQGS